ncbi:MAG: PQQ-binding-like beta-propeller repeat protein [Acidimicrobiales bacterium]
MGLVGLAVAAGACGSAGSGGGQAGNANSSAAPVRAGPPGTVSWTRTVPGSVGPEGLVAEGGKVYAAAGTAVLALDPASGAVLWSHTEPHATYNHVFAAPFGLVVDGSVESYQAGIDTIPASNFVEAFTTSGNLIWRKPYANMLYGLGAGADGALLVTLDVGVGGEDIVISPTGAMRSSPFDYGGDLPTANPVLNDLVITGSRAFIPVIPPTGSPALLTIDPLTGMAGPGAVDINLPASIFAYAGESLLRVVDGPGSELAVVFAPSGNPAGAQTFLVDPSTDKVVGQAALDVVASTGKAWVAGNGDTAAVMSPAASISWKDPMSTASFVGSVGSTLVYTDTSGGDNGLLPVPTSGYQLVGISAGDGHQLWSQPFPGSVNLTLDMSQLPVAVSVGSNVILAATPGNFSLHTGLLLGVQG